MECIEVEFSETPCDGEVREELSTTGESRSSRCERHREEYLERMDEVRRGLDERYPGWDNPHSLPPAWFDPSYAGEEW